MYESEQHFTFLLSFYKRIQPCLVCICHHSRDSFDMLNFTQRERTRTMMCTFTHFNLNTGLDTQTLQKCTHTCTFTYT
jgi:hypothetical protein